MKFFGFFGIFGQTT